MLGAAYADRLGPNSILIVVAASDLGRGSQGSQGSQGYPRGTLAETPDPDLPESTSQSAQCHLLPVLQQPRSRDVIAGMLGGIILFGLFQHRSSSLLFLFPSFLLCICVFPNALPKKSQCLPRETRPTPMDDLSTTAPIRHGKRYKRYST